MARLALRGALSAPGLLREARKSFERIPDPVRGRKRVLADYLMSGLAVFGLKFPSLLQFDRGARDDGLIRENL
ncbi:MAG: transposase, partial [Gammaproteobacteria bacterium]|nr:transposase [Gammaproteobacteria bacterium]